MNAYIGLPTLYGSSEEDLDSIITVFNTMGRKCRVKGQEMFPDMPVMMKGDALK